VDAIPALAQALGLSFTAGISLYATVAVVGLMDHLGWIGPLPGALAILADPWVFGVAGGLAAIEALALLVPGFATMWEAVHTAIRPVGAAVLGALATWGSPRGALVGALVGGAVGLGTHLTKLGARATIDTSPEPVTNAAATGAELGLVALVGWAVWEHPWLALAAVLASFALLALLARAVFRALRGAFGALFGGEPRGGG
jgi:hypothetical protein